MKFIIIIFLCSIVSNIGWCQNKTLINSHERAEDLVENNKSMIINLPQMDKLKLTSARLSVTPWSGDYWPLKKGMIAFRYADPARPQRGTWKKYLDFAKIKNIEEYLKKGKGYLLSPAEKYDLLVGDKEGHLTQFAWNQGQSYYDSEGHVEDWMGICQGWAAASFLLERPLKKIRVQAVNGSDIDFFPTDLKALASMLWDQAYYPIRFIGARCNSKNPSRDNNGRIIDPQCFDINPATWHLAVINQIGVVKKSFIMDINNDFEVWNRPVLGYSLHYFNPQSRKISSRALKASIPLSSYKLDPYQKYRSSQSRKIVGVHMKVTYVDGSKPLQRRVDSTNYDIIKTVTYIYDLELDENHNIIGGEWHSKNHPDFLWTPSISGKDLALKESEIPGEWMTKDDKLPFSWSTAAITAADRGLPLYKIIYNLIELSRNQ